MKGVHMTGTQYDIITVGGGLGGAALARAMAEAGKRVLVLEREQQFKDRVRGEYLSPWGVAEARLLGIYEMMRDQCGTDAPIVDMGFGPRDLMGTTPQQLPALGFCHPEMQEVLLASAGKAGAEVRRGAVVTSISNGSKPSVSFQSEGRVEEIQARLVVAADGRVSTARKWAGFTAKDDTHTFLFAGLLLKEVAAPPGQAYLLFNPSAGMATAMTPVGQNRSRLYVCYQTSAPYRLQGNENVELFINEARKAPQVADFFGSAKPIGPLASFSCSESWVEHPYKNGVALVGDAAATTDPSFGQGLSLTVRDVRVLRDRLLETDDWDRAAHDYAAEHDGYLAVVHRVEGWFRKLFLEQGSEADARRARALPLLAQDLTRAPDHLLSGPELPADESVRRRFFGEPDTRTLSNPAR
jgi:menaquinone-9 beta-reductase